MSRFPTLDPKMTRVLVAIAAVVGLALLIFGASALSSTKKPAETVATTTQLSAEAQADILAQRAVAAESANDTATALSLAESALKLNAANQTAAAVVRRVGGTNTNPGTNPTTTKPTTNTTTTADTWSKPIKDMESVLPTGIAGWTAGNVVSQKGDAQVTFSPDADGTDSGSAIRATFAVHDRGSVAKANTFVKSVDKKVYPGSGATMKFGTQSGYFGTDGARLAVAAFARGRYAFEVVVYSQEGIKPSTLRPLAVKLAAAWSAAR